MMSVSFRRIAKLSFVLLLLLTAAGVISQGAARAEENGPNPHPQAEPTPVGAVGQCELVDGSWEICYDPMCEPHWHEPEGQQGEWVLHLNFGFRGCNPYDGCVYTTHDTCDNGCDTSDPYNHTCNSVGGDVNPEDDPANQDHPNGDIDNWEDPNGQDHPNGDIDNWEDPAGDLCYQVFCPEAACSGDTSYYGGGECDPVDGLCAYPASEFCEDGCDAATGRCVDFSGEDYCASNPCEPFCEGDVSWHSGQCDPADGGCFYTQETCANGCDSSTGYCTGAEEGLCAGVSCQPFCENGESYYNGTCDPADGGCLYNVIACENGCDDATGYCLDANSGGLCAGVTCPSFCDGDTSWYDGQCDPADGQCVYYTTSCENGCWESSGLCVPDSGGGFDDLLGILAVGGGVLVAGGSAAGGGLLLHRFLKGRKPPGRKPPVPTPSAPQPAVEPVINDLNRQTDRIDKLLERLDNIHRDHLQHGMDFGQRMAEIAERKEDVVNTFDTGTRLLKKAADTGADIVGLTPGIGRKFKYGYKAVTNFIESGLDSYFTDGSALDAVGSGITKGAVETAKAVIGDRAGDFVPIPGVNDLGAINMRYARESVTSIIKQKGLANYGMNIIKDKAVGEGVNQGERLVKVFIENVR